MRRKHSVEQSLIEDNETIDFNILNTIMWYINKGQEWLATTARNSFILGAATQMTFVLFSVFIWVKLYSALEEVWDINELYLEIAMTVMAVVIVYWNWYIGYKLINIKRKKKEDIENI